MQKEKQSMEVFLTGATGYIGEVVSEKLGAAGHSVLGLARSEESADKLRARGIEPHRGDLHDLESLAEGARRGGGVIDTAESKSEDSLPEKYAVTDAATSAMLDALEGSGKPFIRTSGTGVLADLAGGEASDVVYDEDDSVPAPHATETRLATDRKVLRASRRGVRGVVFRPPLVYGRGGSSQVPLLIEDARRAGTARYVGAGANAWSTVHIGDLADLYVLALEEAPAGSLFYPASGEVSMKALAESVGRALGLEPPARSITLEEAARDWGDIAPFMASNCRASGEKARASLGWKPSRPSITEDVEHGSYSPRA